MKGFLKSLLLILTTLVGTFVAIGMFLERCKKTVELKPQAKKVPHKKPCEEAICAVDQCMPF